VPWAGCEIRERPDGGREFDLAEPTLSWIRIDFQVRLQFGEAELQIEGPFALRVLGNEHQLDPADRSGLGPLLAVYPDTAQTAAMDPDGTLRLLFVSGASLTVPPDDLYEAWNIGGFWCPPGGFR